MIFGDVFFQDQCIEIEDRLPLVGLAVATVKLQLRESFNIPYFADAIVNCDVVAVGFVLRDGDRLQFQKRFGVKGGDGQPSQEREAEGLIHAYGLVKIANDVKSRNLSKDESIDLMTVMVGQWAAHNFGRPDTQAEMILAEIARRLASIEAHQHGTGCTEARLTVTEQEILESLGDKKMTGEKLAKESDYQYDGHFKGTLSSLVKRGILRNDRPGYRKSKSGLGQD